ncbi:extracellular solute-binding protein [Actinopolymorpha sp. B17G11]|uniref:ABC transporter substrate-binding protein n=1 Tax=unclassified Actinopolymorpha TaxID=2627063 RepID=UPI0032D99495
MSPVISRRGIMRGALGIGALLTTASTGGCSSGSRTTGTPGTATYWSALEGGEVRGYFADTIAAGFTEQYPGERVELVYKTSENLERDVRLALAAGTAPDVIETNGPAFVPELADQDYLADLTKRASDLGWNDVLLPWVPSVGTIDGKLFSIPTQFETLGIFYNATLFERRGYTPPRSRTDLEALCEELTNEGIVPFAAGNREFAQTIEWFTSVFFSHFAGPQVMYDVLTGAKPWTTPPMVEAAALMQDYFRRGWFGGSPQRYFTTSFNAMHADLAAGKAAMDMEGTWFFAEIDSFFGKQGGNANDWGFAAFPALRDAVPYPLYAVGTGATLSINADSVSADEAAHFIDFLIGDRKAAAQRIADHPSEFALPLRFTESDFPQSMDPRIRTAYVDLMAATGKGNIGYTNWTFSAPRTAIEIYEKAQELVADDLSPEDYLAGIEDTFQSDLERGFTPVAIDPRAGDE